MLQLSFDCVAIWTCAYAGLSPYDLDAIPHKKISLLFQQLHVMHLPLYESTLKENANPLLEQAL